MARAGKEMTPKATAALAGYDLLLSDVVRVIEEARRAAARSVNAVMTATYWLVGRRIVEQEQAGHVRAGYGEALLQHLAADLTDRFRRGFSRQNLQQMRQFYLAYPPDKIRQTLSGRSSTTSPAPPIRQTPSGESGLAWPGAADLASAFPLPWSHYVRLLAVRNEYGRSFYEAEALRGGWTVRQLDRQIQSQFYERTALSRNKAAMLRKGEVAKPEDAVAPEEEIKDPYVLEFLSLKDEYSETQVEEALIRHLETFLLELGDDFAFVGRQRRLRLDDEWYRIDLLFFHRRLHCLVVIDLKLGKFTHADAGQMHLYLNYAREHSHRAAEKTTAGSLLFSVSNHHTGSSGQSPAIDGDAPGRYVGYFVNEHGEQSIYTYDFETGEATLKMGDSGWQATHPVVNGEVNGLLLTKAELTWLRACWMATGELVRQRRSGEDAGHPRA